MDIDISMSRPERRTAELRGQCPVEILEVLDAVSLARDQDRTELVNEILGDWARLRMHEASLINRVKRRNPSVSDAAGVSSD